MFYEESGKLNIRNLKHSDIEINKSDKYNS